MSTNDSRWMALLSLYATTGFLLTATGSACTKTEHSSSASEPKAKAVIQSTPEPGAKFALDALKAGKGKLVFEMKGCTGCHSIGGGDLSGPDLAGLFDRRSVQWVRGWIRDPDAFFAAEDPTAKAMLQKYMTKMPNMGLTDEEVEDVMHHIVAGGAAK